MYFSFKPAARIRTTAKLPKFLDIANLHAQLKYWNNSTNWHRKAHDQIYNATNNTLEFVSAKSRDWFYENIQIIKDILKKKKKEE